MGKVSRHDDGERNYGMVNREKGLVMIMVRGELLLDTEYGTIELGS